MSNITVRRAGSFMGAFVCALVCGNVSAGERDVTLSMRVSSARLDLNRPADAAKFYARLKKAARDVCTDRLRVGLEPVDDPNGCAEKSLGHAVRSIDAPAITQIYLASHTLQQAAAAGISVSLQAAARH